MVKVVVMLLEESWEAEVAVLMMDQWQETVQMRHHQG